MHDRKAGRIAKLEKDIVAVLPDSERSGPTARPKSSWLGANSRRSSQRATPLRTAQPGENLRTHRRELVVSVSVHEPHVLSTDLKVYEPLGAEQ
jgi:hypothetical protein